MPKFLPFEIKHCLSFSSFEERWRHCSLQRLEQLTDLYFAAGIREGLNSGNERTVDTFFNAILLTVLHSFCTSLIIVYNIILVQHTSCSITLNEVCQHCCCFLLTSIVFQI